MGFLGCWNSLLSVKTYDGNAPNLFILPIGKSMYYIPLSFAEDHMPYDHFHIFFLAINRRKSETSEKIAKMSNIKYKTTRY